MADYVRTSRAMGDGTVYREAGTFAGWELRDPLGTRVGRVVQEDRTISLLGKDRARPGTDRQGRRAR